MRYAQPLLQQDICVAGICAAESSSFTTAPQIAATVLGQGEASGAVKGSPTGSSNTSVVSEVGTLALPFPPSTKGTPAAVLVITKCIWSAGPDFLSLVHLFRL